MTGKDNPRSPVAKIRLEKRAGKAVTVIAGLHTYGAARLDAIARELKSTLATGGTVKNGVIEIQGDKVVPVKAWFIDRSTHVKG
jgi:translation initiation factor 1